MEHRTHRSRMSSTSLRGTPSSSLTYAELRSRFPSKFIIFRCFLKPAWSPSRTRVSSLRTKSQKKLSTAALQTFRSFFTAIFTAFRRLLLWAPPLSVAMLRPLQPTCCFFLLIVSDGHTYLLRVSQVDILQLAKCIADQPRHH